MSGARDARFAPFEPLRPDARPVSDLLLRPARREDALPLARMLHEREGAPVDELLARLSARLEAPGGRFLLVAAVGDEVAGFGEAALFRPPPDAPAHSAPQGWYLGGLLVRPGLRRRGIGTELTRERLRWISARASRAYYFANSRNLASIALHRRLGFREETRCFWYPGVSFVGGEGILFSVPLPPAAGG